MNISILSIILTVVVTHFLALLSPGPDFMLLVKSGVRNGFRKSWGLPMGIAFANGVYITLCIIGLGEFLVKSVILLRVLKLLGGLFLLYISISALKAKKEDYDDIDSEKGESLVKSSFLGILLTGFISGISNPKNLVFYLSLFSMVLTDGINQQIKISLGIWMTSIVFLWDSFILIILSREIIQKRFIGIVYYIDKVAGVIIGSLGLKLVISAIKEDYI